MGELVQRQTPNSTGYVNRLYRTGEGKMSDFDWVDAVAFNQIALDAGELTTGHVLSLIHI